MHMPISCKVCSLFYIAPILCVCDQFFLAHTPPECPAASGHTPEYNVMSAYTLFVLLLAPFPSHETAFSSAQASQASVQLCFCSSVFFLLLQAVIVLYILCKICGNLLGTRNIYMLAVVEICGIIQIQFIKNIIHVQIIISL